MHTFPLTLGEKWWLGIFGISGCRAILLLGHAAASCCLFRQENVSETFEISSTYESEGNIETPMSSIKSDET